MKSVKYILAIWMAWGFIFAAPSIAQQESRHGAQLTPRGTVRVLVVFAELTGGCGTSGPSGWTPGQLPDNVDLYIDDVVSSTYTTAISRYYRDISLGELDVIGDYYGEIVQVPCSTVNTNSSTDGDNQVIEELNDPVTGWQPAADGNYYTARGHNLDDFDIYSTQVRGFEKMPGSNGNIDVTIILYRNHYGFFGCGSGFGVGNILNEPLAGKNVSVFGCWGFCPNDLTGAGYDRLLPVEFFHALMGGNNFHTGGGADIGTFMFDPSSFSTSAQSGSQSNIVCGWDRQFLDWRGTRQFPISAENQSGQEVVSDISVATHPNTSFFVLNDFVTVGDAIRIKLPHFDWQANGDKKNQYLWVENHQQVNEFDKSKSASSCSDWVPGMHAYIQVGKDLIVGDVYGGSFAEPNDLNGWLFPLPAEGRHDFFYSDTDQNQNWANCAWGNFSMPYAIQYPDGSTLPNPFTGYSDAFALIDSNNDGELLIKVPNGGPWRDRWQPRFQKWLGTPNVGSPPAPTIPNWGDDLDPFTTTGQKIGMGTNPASTPVYTSREGASAPSNYDNRSIHLNNISVTIVDDDYYNVGNSGPKSLLVCVKFDDKKIEEDVRWCGNVVLRNDPMDPANRQMEIDVQPNKCITLDKGLSPTQLNEVTPGSRDFTDSSYLHILNGTIMRLRTGAKLKVQNGSVFHVQAGANLIIGPNAEITVDATSDICIEPGANVTFQNPVTSKIIINGKPYTWDKNLLNLTLSSASTNYYALNNITTGGTSPGVSMPSSGSVLLQAGNTIVMGNKTIISPNSGQSFRARIQLPYDCSNTENYNESFPPDVPGSAADYHTHDHEVVAGELPEEEEETIAKGFEGLTLYPNPASDIVYIQHKEALDLPVDVEIYNAVGTMIHRKSFATDGGIMALYTSDWLAGMYILKISRNGITASQKLVIK